MCGIFGIIGSTTKEEVEIVSRLAATRGRDGYGMLYIDGASAERRMTKTPGKRFDGETHLDSALFGFVIGSCRAEPTTELVQYPTHDDQQPYTLGEWAVVHNGVIANDKDLIEEYGFNPPTRIDSWVIIGLLDALSRRGYGKSSAFQSMLSKIVGSFAIIATHTDRSGKTTVFYATNYRPLYLHTTHGLELIYSSVDMTGEIANLASVELVQPYSWGMIEYGEVIAGGPLIPARKEHEKTLVVLSGGLDSTTVAALCIEAEHEVEFLHFDYGCRATSNERLAVEQIAAHYKRPLHVIDMRSIFQQIGHSRLTDTKSNSPIDNGEAGAEQAIEWVPARNTILASVAMGIAEANDFSQIALGINLEESGGGYTDNVLDLYEGLNNLNQWIVGVNKRVRFVSPVGHMMKHEIVMAGVKARAPYYLTWSCYNQGEVHCGACGPCIMRRRAFRRNGLSDPVPFACDEAGTVATEKA